jgi:hypothetical protein
LILLHRYRLTAVFLLSLVALVRLCGAGFEADIPFEFQAGKQVLPPGTYKFTFNVAEHNVCVAKTGMHEVRLPVITRLGTRGPSDEGALVFDKLNDVRSLSEVWIPSLDGLLVHSIPEEHVHEVVHVVSR